MSKNDLLEKRPPLSFLEPVPYTEHDLLPVEAGQFAGVQLTDGVLDISAVLRQLEGGLPVVVYAGQVFIDTRKP